MNYQPGKPILRITSRNYIREKLSREVPPGEPYLREEAPRTAYPANFLQEQPFPGNTSKNNISREILITEPQPPCFNRGQL